MKCEGLFFYFVLVGCNEVIFCHCERSEAIHNQAKIESIKARFFRLGCHRLLQRLCNDIVGRSLCRIIDCHAS
ncbi:hypothetical protein [Helicobacter sp.]|uniref:hypothetical protein n=1 Tax=Helicobacter sp. TaxID=218 RepID=UPI0019903F5D|nr:hypothetical protein [Helicobacter sp.]MBD5164879.1 hypothetical protein [Helicobacter sp.]